MSAVLTVVGIAGICTSALREELDARFISGVLLADVNYLSIRALRQSRVEWRARVYRSP
jgi:hypothetical protein